MSESRAAARLVTGSGSVVVLDGAELATFGRTVQLGGWVDAGRPVPVHDSPVLRAHLAGREPWAVYRAHWDVSGLALDHKWVAVRWPVGAELPAVEEECSGEAAVRLLARRDLEHRTTDDLTRQLVQWGAGMARGLRTTDAAERVAAAGGELGRRYRAARRPGVPAAGEDAGSGPVAFMHRVMRAGMVASTAGAVRAEVAGYGGGDAAAALRMLSLSVLPGVLPEDDGAPVVVFGCLDPVGDVLRTAWATREGGSEADTLQMQADALPALVRAEPGSWPVEY
ncbi:hypothetical protein [Streptomyces sp. IB2014 011-1]|uniref:hypothetical protein n=1 Tax=Streptomyces sp. IB2014 011-1 TaxID=1844478 RepID=UPI000978D892|nr:hypothetical protein [Streptomyces sp. IB2014 011-1]ONI48516.1 hypothetical protein STIB_73410 [Streptomyces sp. IB2014 011-1]